MIHYKGKILLTTAEAAQVMNRSTESIRQMAYRGQLTKHKVGSKLYLDNTEVMTYYPTKTRLPAFESLSPEDVAQSYLSLESVAKILSFGVPYVKRMVTEGRLKGYCTADGKIFVSESSLDDYIGVDANDQANEL